jgi:linoleoyl-CoA desaturase
MQTPRFARRANNFHKDLKDRINDYFQEVGSAPTGNYEIWLKAIILVVGMALTYTWLVFFTPAWYFALLGCLVLALFTAAIGFNVMHDGAHGSFSRYKWVNELAGLSLNMLGANVSLWKTKHNIIHHTYTNIDNIDDDIDAKPFLRMCENQKYYAIHKYQHLYFWLAYAQLYWFWIFFTDYMKYFRGKIGDWTYNKMTWKEHVSFWLFKVVHFSMFIVIPIYMLGFWPWLLGFAVYAGFTGLVLSMVFQMAHTVEDMHFPEVTPEKLQLEDEWAIHQLRTTANFATRNKWLSWYCGGLNFQIEHHLFPNVSHVHYPKISKIIREVCEEYNVPYKEYPRFRLAIASHVRHLYALGRN